MSDRRTKVSVEQQAAALDRAIRAQLRRNPPPPTASPTSNAGATRAPRAVDVDWSAAPLAMFARIHTWPSADDEPLRPCLPLESKCEAMIAKLDRQLTEALVARAAAEVRSAEAQGIDSATIADALADAMTCSKQARFSTLFRALVARVDDNAKLVKVIKQIACQQQMASRCRDYTDLAVLEQAMDETIAAQERLQARDER